MKNGCCLPNRALVLLGRGDEAATAQKTEKTLEGDLRPMIS